MLGVKKLFLNTFRFRGTKWEPWDFQGVFSVVRSNGALSLAPPRRPICTHARFLPAHSGVISSCYGIFDPRVMCARPTNAKKESQRPTRAVVRGGHHRLDFRIALPPASFMAFFPRPVPLTYVHRPQTAMLSSQIVWQQNLRVGP